jgi:hypothetical protein
MSRVAFNPFAEATVAETIPSKEFVDLFCPKILDNASSLFRPGNVVLKGAPGSGKSMLLTLLKPETQIAYVNAGEDFPISSQDSRFISAGINLVRAGTQDLSNRLSSSTTPQDIHELALRFGDFLNYFLTQDLFRNIEKIVKQENNALLDLAGLTNTSAAALDAFASTLSSHQCWSAYMRGVTNYASFMERIDYRLSQYRLFFNNFRATTLDQEIESSITSVGEPLAVVAKALRENGIISQATNVFIRIDQLEELYYLEEKHNLGATFRQIVNKAMAMRDPRLSYRIGTRGYGWEDQLNVYGTDARLERDRDFSVVDLSEVMRRSENAKIWIFPEIANDIVFRRLKSAGYQVTDGQSKDMVSKVFGHAKTPDELAAYYAGKVPLLASDIDQDWPTEWKKYLEDLAQRSPIDAKFACAWARQKGKSDVVNLLFDPLAPPWRSKKYWIKERNELALVQIASARRAALMYSGVEDILALSAGNPLSLLTICRHIWQAWQRSLRSRDELGKEAVPTIDWKIQASGIFDASRHWIEKHILSGHNGDSRRRVVQRLGIWFSEQMRNDIAMSNPGHNGFSLTVDGFEADMGLRELLNFSVDFGDLYKGPHTTKLADRLPRYKWYLAPILCPYFRIPHIRTKEPIYASPERIRGILGEKNFIELEKTKLLTNAEGRQMNLFER